MSAQPFIGQIKILAFDFPPRGHASCNGQILQIQDNTALFSLLGTTYGGDGQTTFALPDLRGRAPMHWGQGPGLSPYSLGQTAGLENHTLINAEMPMHTHNAVASNNNADQTYPPGMTWSNGGSGAGYKNNANAAMHPQVLANTGGSQPHENMHPYLVVNYSIALEGLFPSRN